MKLGLGTAQFGMKYGISNTKGQITFEEAEQILRLAKDLDIDTLDTAAAYGNSETVIGNCNTKGMRIVSKIPPHKDVDNISTWIKEQTDNIFFRCQKESIYALLFHNCDDILTTNGRKSYSYLRHLKEAGVLKKVGVSVYSPEQLERVLAEFDIDIVQLPLNIFDRRFENSGILKKLKQNNIEVHVRSVFLQGLLLMNSSEYPDNFKYFAHHLNQWQNWLKENNIKPLDACIRHIKSYREIDRVIVGIESARNLEEINRAFSSPFLKAPFSLSIEEEALINPSLWNT